MNHSKSLNNRNISCQNLLSTSNKKKCETGDGYTKGSIVRITVNNFLTYDQCTFRLHPKLNVIIGPNGTGKSSIVCAICIGLGGKTSILARAKELVDFIKHGKDSAMIEIEIYNNPKNEVIKRDLTVGNNGKAVSTWYLNGKLCPVKSIEELTNRLNIQLSNLCQFLPQERVSDFAKMNKIELLENTELAICSVAIQNDHAWLKEYRSMEKGLLSKIADDKGFLEKLVQKNERVEKEVKRFNERNALTLQLKNLELKRAWTVYEAARCVYMGKKEVHQKLRKQCNDEEKKTLPLHNEKETIAKHIAANDKQMKAKGEMLKSAAAVTKRLHDQLNDEDEEIQCKWEEYKELEKDEASRMKRIEQCKLQISGWKHELDQLDDADVQNEIDQLNRVIRSTLSAIGQVEHEQSLVVDQKERNIREIEGFESKLAELHNMNKRRLEVLRRRNRDCYNATLWLRSNKSMFRSTVHEPILLSMKMKRREHAELIENHVAKRDLFAFVCEDHNDNQKLIHELREKQGLRINVVRAPTTSNGQLIPPSSYKPQRSLETIKRWGFVSYLRESIDAPDAVMSFLCRQYRVHEIPVGSPLTKRIVDEVTQSSGFGLFFIPPAPGSLEGCRYSVRTSKYSGQRIVGNSSLRKAEFLNIHVNPEELTKIQQEIESVKLKVGATKTRLKELSDEKRKLEKKDNELKQQKKELLNKKNSRKNLENKIMLKEGTLQELEQSGVNLEAAKERVQHDVGTILLKKKDFAIKFVAKIKDCVETSIAKGIYQVDYAGALKRKTAIEEKIHQMKLKNQELLRALERADSEKVEAQNQAKCLLAEAKQLTGGGPDRLDKDCGELPDDLAEIEAKIHECQARLECCGSTDPKAVREFKSRSKEIAKLESKVLQMDGELQSKREEMEVVKSRWLTPLQELVGRINERFSRYFSMMGCAGEVDLHADNEEDFDKYGIRIRVKFRSSSSLQELNPFRQSGGERSVSTMLYLVALQSMYVCPFRVVDEINQGMDPSNERRVFEVIVATSSEEDSASQYFLITPKLLPQLTYNRRMSVHCIYNGPHMLTQKLWKVAKFVRRRKQLVYEDDA